MSDPEFVDDIERVSSATLRSRYRIVAQLGVGGMAFVHLAVARAAAGAEKLVVLKSIRPELAEDTKVITMFADEARLATQLSHPNVVQTYDVIKVNTLPILVMEYLEGQTFSTCVSRRMPLPLRLRVLIDVLSGLEYAHGLKGLDGAPLGLVHRDMSPQNIIITYDGQVKLLDFGVAKALGQVAQTEAGEIKGKLRYMAPEQMIAKAPIDRRADLFSVGVMLWETLTQRVLWDGISDVEVIQTVLESGIPAPRAVAPDVDPELQRVCLKAVAEDRDARYASARDMQDDLVAVMTARGYQATARDLAPWLETTFADRRERVREIIRTQRERDHSKVVAITRDASTTSGSNMELCSPRPGTLPTHFRTDRSRPAASAKRWGLVGGAGLVLVLLTALGLHGAKRPEGPPASPAPSATALPLATAPSPAPSATPPPGASQGSPVEIELDLAAAPKSARLFLDGDEIHNPFSGKRQSDGANHVLRAEARGYVPKSVDVPFGNEPLQVTVTLERQPPPGAGKRAGANSAVSAVSAVSAGKTPAPPAATQCDSPFYRDSDGIMHARPGCIQ